MASDLKYQKGQAMLFGLFFLAVVVMAMLILFNQGQLVKNRVQLENAADAAVYSQAKLAARHQNFIAYTNRAMVANEVSIGQMVALLSWAKHYKNVGSFTNYPLYQTPIVPPSPVTYAQVLNAVTLPYKIMGTAVSTPTAVLVDHWPKVVSYFNSALGLFQKIFALSTMEAQIELNLDVVKDHEFDKNDGVMYTPVVGWYFFTQNILLTYFGENFNSDKLASLVGDSDKTTSVDEEALLQDFLADQTDLDELENMINDNSPGISRKKNKNVSGGKDSHLNADEDDEGDSAIEAYQRYAAIVNRNREGFTADRHWNVGGETGDLIPDLKFDLGVLKIELNLDLSFWTGLRNDGGAAYIGNDLEADSDIESLGWAAMDVASFGIEFYFNLFFKVEVCIFGCSTIVKLDFGGTLPIGLPLAGATHQVVSDNQYAKRFLTDWGDIGSEDTGMWGGEDGDKVNDGALDWFHLNTLAWGQISPTTGGGMYGANVNQDVSDSYAAPPSFYSLGSSFQESGISYEYTVALTKSFDDIETTDEGAFGVTGNENDWGDGSANSAVVDHTRFDVASQSRAEDGSFEGGYQQMMWGDDRPMMTVSSAETYFANPMQETEAGTAEPASLFSPFWDARLREPSAITLLIATGEIDWQEIFEGLSGSAVDIVEWMLNAVGDRVVETGVDYLLDQMDPPFDVLLEEPINNAADSAKDTAVDAVVGELEDYLP